MEIRIQYDTMKYNALQFALEQGGKDVQTELGVQLDKMFDRHVPASIRAFVQHTAPALGTKAAPQKPPAKQAQGD